MSALHRHGRTAHRHLDPFKGDLVPQTRANPALLRQGKSQRRRAFCAANCAALADFMEALPAEKHYQGRWTTIPENHVCGTRACALGVASLSHLIPGLQYAFENGKPSINVSPTINGRRALWTNAGIAFFGFPAYARVFRKIYLSKAEVVALLRQLVNTYADTQDEI